MRLGLELGLGLGLGLGIRLGIGWELLLVKARVSAVMLRDAPQ